MTENEDRLIRVLLCELLAGEEPPDVTERVLARALPRLGVGWRWFLRVAAAAAVVIVASAVWLIFHGGPPAPRTDAPAARAKGDYPAPRASGDYRVAGGGPVRRGAAVASENGGARLTLGGYCRVDMAPRSTVRIAGRRRAERLVLERGELTCAVSPGRGAFAVETEAGTVSVTGTEFVVGLVGEQGGAAMVGKRMFVKVLVGTVLLTGAMGEIELAAGEEATAKQGTIHAGKPVYRAKNHPAWAEKGRVIGPVRPGAPACKIEVVNAAGTVVASAAPAKGAKGYELKFLAPGVYTLRVGAAGFATLVVKGLEVRAKHDVSIAIEFDAAGQPPAPGEKTIHAGKPVYRAKNHPAWAEKGRVIGPVRPGAPACKVALLNAEGRVVKVAELPKGAKGYEFGFLAPGAYTLRITAEGYPKLEVKGLEVRAKHDVSVAIEFGN